MKSVSHILIVLSIISLCKAQCGPPNDDPSSYMFSNINAAIERISSCDFPADKFNASCVSASCHQLASSGLCPYTSTQNLNLTALTSILSILNSCFKQQTTICDTPLNNIPIPPVGINLNEVFDGLPVGGTTSIGPNKGVVNNVQDVSFTIHQNHISTSGSLSVLIHAPGIMLTGVIQCVITVPMGDLPSPTFNLPNISSSIALAISPVATIDFINERPDVRVRADNFTMNYEVGNFAPTQESFVQFPAGLDSLFTSGVTALWKNSSNPAAVANFYATFIAHGIAATKGNCPM